MIIPTIDVVEEISSNRERYTGTVTLDLGPGWWFYHLSESIERVHVHLASPRPDLDTTIACCLAHGTEAIRSDADVQKLISIKGQLRAGMLGEADDDVEEIFGFASVPLSTLQSVSVAISGSKKQNSDYKRISLPRSVKLLVSRLAEDLSASKAVIATIASMIVLSTQDAVLNGHKDKMKDKVSFFFHKVRLRKKVAEAFLLTLDELPSNRQGSDSKRRNLR